jgi:hypothetical protein
MTAIRMRCLAVLCCLALAACDHDRTFDASSLPAYQKSLIEITARLSADDQRRLSLALTTLAVGNSAASAFLTNPGAVEVVPSRDVLANPPVYLDRLRPMIDHKSAVTVMQLAADRLDAQISQIEAQSKANARLLSSIVIEHARYYWEKSAFTDLPNIEFSIYNGSNSAISRIYLSAALTSRGRATPWVASILTHSFEDGLQPGVEEQVKLTPGLLGDWADKQLQTVTHADFMLAISNMEDEGGRKLLPFDNDFVDVLRAKRDFLRGS